MRVGVGNREWSTNRPSAPKKKWKQLLSACTWNICRMTAKCPSKKVTCQRVETMMLIGWIAKWDAKILAWNSPFRLEILYFVLSQISGSLPFNSSYLAFFAFLCADQLREWNEYSWYSGKCIWETKKRSGCSSAHEAHWVYVQGREGGDLHSLCSSSPAVVSCLSSASVPTSKILGLWWENEEWWWERGGKNVFQIYTSQTCLISLCSAVTNLFIYM